MFGVDDAALAAIIAAVAEAAAASAAAAEAAAVTGAAATAAAGAGAAGAGAAGAGLGAGLTAAELGGLAATDAALGAGLAAAPEVAAGGLAAGDLGAMAATDAALGGGLGGLAEAAPVAGEIGGGSLMGAGTGGTFSFPMGSLQAGLKNASTAGTLAQTGRAMLLPPQTSAGAPRPSMPAHVGNKPSSSDAAIQQIMRAMAARRQRRFQ